MDKLVFYEETSDVLAAIAREKQIKAGSRQKKIALIDGMNPGWRDSYDELVSRGGEIASSLRSSQ